MSESVAKWYLRTPDETFGPETEERLVDWARKGRILPGQEVSDDNLVWRRAEEVPFLDMRFSIDVGDGNPRGPFNRVAAEALVASGRLAPGARVVEVREPFADAESPEPAPSEPEPAPAEPEVAPAEPEAASGEAEVPPVEPDGNAGELPSVKVVERIVEKTVTVVDETRVRELEGLLAEERRHTGELQGRLDDAQKSAADSRARITKLELAVGAAAERERALQQKFERELRDAVDREGKLREQVRALEDELRRLPQAASEVADIQAAMYSVMTKEAEELQRLMDAEKAEADEFRRRHEERADRLLQRRRDILKRAGANIEDMTRKALYERPEDPRTVQLRREYEDYRRAAEKRGVDSAARIRELEASLADYAAQAKREAANGQDVTQLRNENAQLRAQLQRREQELVAERQKAEETRQNVAVRQQAMMARIASLESPSIAPPQSLATNQSREAKLVKLPRWMQLGR